MRGRTQEYTKGKHRGTDSKGASSLICMCIDEQSTNTLFTKAVCVQIDTQARSERRTQGMWKELPS